MELDSSYLGKSFAAASYGNYVVAIVAGLMANSLAESSPMVEWSTGATVAESTGKIFIGGYINPFDCAVIALIACGGGALYLWEENFGSQNVVSKGGSCDALTNATHTVIRNEDVLLCGIISRYVYLLIQRGLKA